MKRKYPAKMFWRFALTDFLFHFFFLSIPGIILCIVGIWVKCCLWIGLAILGLDAVLSIFEQLRIRKAAVTPSDNPEFNAIMDAFCSPDSLDAVGRILDEKSKSSPSVKAQEAEK